jgi:hypothetical protein
MIHIAQDFDDFWSGSWGFVLEVEVEFEVEDRYRLPSL